MLQQNCLTRSEYDSDTFVLLSSQNIKYSTLLGKVNALPSVGINGFGGIGSPITPRRPGGSRLFLSSPYSTVIDVDATVMLSLR